jgi:hypothetical protein
MDTETESIISGRDEASNRAAASFSAGGTVPLNVLQTSRSVVKEGHRSFKASGVVLGS